MDVNRITPRSWQEQFIPHANSFIFHFSHYTYLIGLWAHIKKVYMFIFVFFAAVLLFWDPPRNNRDALMPKPNRSQKCSDPGSSWHWSIWPFQHNHHHSYCSPGVLSLRKYSPKSGRDCSLFRVNSLFPVPLGVNQQNVGIFINQMILDLEDSSGAPVFIMQTELHISS